MNQHKAAWTIIKNGGQSRKTSAGDIRQRLALCHYVEVDVSADCEEAQNLIQHFPMLARRQNADINLAPVPRQFLDNRCHLDSVGTGADDDVYQLLSTFH
jgi:hypothetical protein